MRLLHIANSVNYENHSFLFNNQSLSAADFGGIERLRKQLLLTIAHRNTTYTPSHTDYEFVFPGSLWSPILKKDAHSFVSLMWNLAFEADPTQYRHFRIFSAFSGEQITKLAFPSQEESYADILESWKSITTNLLNDQNFPTKIDNAFATQKPENNTWYKLWTNLAAHTPIKFCFSPPLILGEYGWKSQVKKFFSSKKITVNYDTYVIQERITLLYESGILDQLLSIAKKKSLNILEIGAGHGGLALALNSIFPSSQYWICDLPESLLFSGSYLQCTNPKKKTILIDDFKNKPQGNLPSIFLLPNFLFPELERNNFKFDLIINTLSLSEMNEQQIRTYAKGISNLLAENMVFFEQNQDNSHCEGVNCHNYLKDYFKNKMIIKSKILHPTQGLPTLWSN